MAQSLSQTSEPERPVLDSIDQARLRRYHKMEDIIARMQMEQDGVPIRDFKSSLLGKITPSVFSGNEMIDWLMKKFVFFDRDEAIHFAKMLHKAGYLFPIDSATVKDDSGHYRFQTPYFYPSQGWEPSDFDHAVYLVKRRLRDQKKYQLQENELETLATLQRRLNSRWEFVIMQAEEQVKSAKSRNKKERRIFDSQEFAFWKIHRPPPDATDTREVDPRKAFSSSDEDGNHKRKTPEQIKAAMNERAVQLKLAIARPKTKVSLAAEGLVSRCEVYAPFDPFVTPMEPSNPWISEDTAAWDEVDKSRQEPSVLSAKRWGISLFELLNDPPGLRLFQEFLKKEFSDENINFWLATRDLQRVKPSAVKKEAKALFDNYIAPNAPHEVNVNSATREITIKNMEAPGYDSFDEAQAAVFNLMSRDSYPRFLRSEAYQNLIKPPAPVV